MEQTKKEKLLTINITQREVVFHDKLNVDETLNVLSILNELEKQFQEHLLTVITGATLEFGQECALKKEMEEKLTPQDALKLIEKIYTKQ